MTGIAAAVKWGVAASMLLPGALAIIPSHFDPQDAPQVERTIRVAAVGDSLTAWDNTTWPVGPINPESWVPHALSTDPDLQLVGGWALGGTTIDQMSDHIQPTDADVLVVMAGTNDVRLGDDPDMATHFASLLHIVKTVDAPHVIVLAIPPSDAWPARSAGWNTSMSHFAHAHHWDYFDPWASVRTSSNNWVAGTSRDPLHPTDVTATIEGLQIGSEIERVTSQPKGHK